MRSSGTGPDRGCESLLTALLGPALLLGGLRAQALIRHGEVAVTVLRVAAGGEIGRHPATVDQLFLVVEGRGDVCGEDGSLAADRCRPGGPVERRRSATRRGRWRISPPAPPRLVDVFTLSPLGVRPEFQGRGIGTQLVAHALAEADRDGVPLVFLEGSPRYYGRRGFRRAAEFGFRAPSLRIPVEAFQVATLGSYERWMTVTYVYSETFWALDCVGLRELQ